jgi:hypothetical protein
MRDADTAYKKIVREYSAEPTVTSNPNETMQQRLKEAVKRVEEGKESPAEAFKPDIDAVRKDPYGEMQYIEFFLERVQKVLPMHDSDLVHLALIDLCKGQTARYIHNTAERTERWLKLNPQPAKKSAEQEDATKELKEMFKDA